MKKSKDMKDKMRKAFLDEMKTIKQEISNTKSEYRKRDLRKKLHKMKKQLREYDSYRNC